MKETTHPNGPETYRAPRGDDINLVDLWLSLQKHGRSMAITFGIVMLLGLLLTLFLSKKYEIMTSLAIGTSLQGTEVKPIESPETVKAKLVNSFIPSLNTRFNEKSDSPTLYRVDVYIPKNSSLIVMKSKSSDLMEKTYIKFHNALITFVISDHKKLINVLKTNLRSDLNRAKIEQDRLSDETTLKAKKSRFDNELQSAESDLKELKDPKIFGAIKHYAENVIRQEQLTLSSLKEEAKVIQAQLHNIDSNQELIRKQITVLEKQIADSLTLQKQSSASVNDSTHAMAQLMIDNDIQQNRKWLSALKERLYIELEDKRAEIHKLAEDNIHQQAFQQEKIKEAEASLQKLLEVNKLDQVNTSSKILEIRAQIGGLVNDQKRRIADQKQITEKIKAKLDNFLETRAVVPPTRSLEPISLSSTIIILLSIVAGLLAALFTAFFAELRSRASMAAAKFA